MIQNKEDSGYSQQRYFISGAQTMDSFPDGIAVSSETRKQVMIYLLGGVIVALIVLFSIPMLLNDAESSNGFLPHAFCYLKTQPLIWLHVISDSLIGLAYTAIPAALF